MFPLSPSASSKTDTHVLCQDPAESTLSEPPTPPSWLPGGLRFLSCPREPFLRQTPRIDSSWDGVSSRSVSAKSGLRRRVTDTLGPLRELKRLGCTTRHFTSVGEQDIKETRTYLRRERDSRLNIRKKFWTEVNETPGLVLCCPLRRVDGDTDKHFLNRVKYCRTKTSPTKHTSSCRRWDGSQVSGTVFSNILHIIFNYFVGRIF